MTPDEFADDFLHDCAHIANKLRTNKLRNLPAAQFQQMLTEAEERTCDEPPFSYSLRTTIRNTTASSRILDEDIGPVLIAAVLARDLAEHLTRRTDAKPRKPAHCHCCHCCPCPRGMSDERFQ